MSNQVILKAPHEALSTVSRPFTGEGFTDGSVATLAQDLIDTLRGEKHGIALAANQIGVTRRMFVTRDPANPETGFMVFVNPVIVKEQKPTIHKEEGCLSLDKTKLYDVPRYNRVTVRFRDLKGNPRKLKFQGFMAFVMQHEIDHLDGLLLND